MNLSIIIPTYYEEKRLEKTLKELISFCKGLKNYEIVILDDNSKDKTVEIAEKYKNKRVRVIAYSKRRGKGYTIKEGFKEAKYDLILFTDADLPTPLGEFENLNKYIDSGYDLVIGSRVKREKQPFVRKIMGFVFAVLVKIITLSKIKDTQCGFKLIKANAAKRIAKLQKINGFAFDVEVLLIAKKLGFKIKEVPVKWTEKGGSRLSPFRSATRMLKELIKIEIYNLSGDYNEK